MDIVYKDDVELDLDSVINLYKASTLGERRPVDRPDIFEDMLRHADVIITAWDKDRLVGICRTLTDFSYVAYLADLAVDVEYQRKGIGKKLIEETKSKLGPNCLVVLLAAPKANEYYEPLGFEHNPRAWVLKGELKKA